MRGRKKRALILGILCCLLVFMGVGFAVARTTLNIGGTSTAINTWDVRIANVAVSSKSDDVTIDEENTTIGNDGVSANLKADFVKPGDYVTFEILVENNGSIDATLNDLAIETIPSTEADKNLYIIESTMPENAKLEAGKSLTFAITITFNKDAEKLPEGDVNFGVSLDYSQGNTPEGGGNTPGGGTEPEKDWDFEVDEDGTIIAYNYDLGTDVVIPATNYEGKEITTIVEQSFMPKGNADMYMDETVQQAYFLIMEDNNMIVDETNNRTAYGVVKQKIIDLFITGDCGTDTDCIAQYKAIMNFCSDKDTCYNLSAEEAGNAEKVSISSTAELQQSVYVNPDPNVSIEESLVTEFSPNVITLDLSNATNLTTVGDFAFYSAGLESVEFGENSNITSIGSSAFSNNSLTSVEIPHSVEAIGSNAFSGNQIETLTLDTAIEAQNQLTKNNKYSLTKLGTAASKLTTTLKGVKSIGESAFYNNKISELEIPSTVKTIGARAFENNQISKKLVISDELTSIGMYVFAKNLIEEVSIIQASENVISLLFSADYTFKDNFLTSLTIPDYIIHIGAGVFENNKITGELVLSDNIQNVDYSAFRNNLITSLVLEKIIPMNHSTYSGSFSGNEIQTLKIKHCTITSCVESFWDGFTEQADSVKKLVISGGEVGVKAFHASNNPKLETLILGEGVTKVLNEAFAYNNISELVIPTSLSDIGDYAFEGNKISKLYYPKTVENLGKDAFYSNPFDELIIEEHNSSLLISSSAPFGYNIKELTIESGSIPTRAFQGTEIEKLTIGSGVTSIGALAFTSPVLTTIVIKRTESDFLANVTVESNWYIKSLNPTITYDPS